VETSVALPELPLARMVMPRMGNTPWNGDVPFSVVCAGTRSRREGVAIGEERRWFGVASGRFGDRIAV
jgi:hypothetical protein